MNIGDNKEEFLRQIENGMRSCKEKLSGIDFKLKTLNEPTNERIAHIILELQRKGTRLENQIKAIRRLGPIAFKAKKEELRSAWNQYRVAVSNAQQGFNRIPDSDGSESPSK